MSKAYQKKMLPGQGMGVGKGLDFTGKSLCSIYEGVQRYGADKFRANLPYLRSLATVLDMLVAYLGCLERLPLSQSRGGVTRVLS